jgi:hypothetical protein
MSAEEYETEEVRSKSSVICRELSAKLDRQIFLDFEGTERGHIRDPALDIMPYKQNNYTTKLLIVKMNISGLFAGG